MADSIGLAENGVGGPSEPLGAEATLMGPFPFRRSATPDLHPDGSAGIQHTIILPVTQELILINTSASGSIQGMEVVGVPEAAKQLGISAERVRQLIQSGRLSAQSIGGRWLVDRDSLHRISKEVRSAGRPYSPARAWAILALAAGEDPAWLPDRDIRHLRSVLANRGVGDVHHQLRHRAESEDWYLHPSLLNRFVAEDGVVIGGARASKRLRSSGPVEVYVSRSALGRLIERYRPDRGARDPNVILRVVRGPWPFAPGQHEVWSSVAAADLLDRPEDDRAVRVAHELLGSTSA